MEVVDVLALIAGAINAYAFWLYNQDVFVGKTVPNTATWTLWAVVTIVQTLTFDSMGVRWSKVVVMGTDALLCLGTFIYLLCMKKLEWPDKRSEAIIATSLWTLLLSMSKLLSATACNFISQAPYAMAFWPTIRDARNGKTIEVTKVWVLFTLSFVLSLIVIGLDWPENKWEFFSPAVAIVMHAILAYYAFRGRRLYARQMPRN